ncbi:MAG TPA: Na+/H+ antiporter, partial [Chitinophaga sp.]
GVVSLAAALSIPILMDNGQPFPQRNLILFITFVVILVTLVFQGLTLPLLLRWLRLKETDNQLSSEEQEALIRRKLGEKSLELLDGQHAELLTTNEALQRLRLKINAEFGSSNPEAQRAQAEYRQVLMLLLAEKRKLLHDINKDIGIDEELIRKYQRLLDLEEEESRTRTEAG